MKNKFHQATLVTVWHHILLRSQFLSSSFFFHIPADGLEMLERAIRDALADTVAAASAYAAKFQAYAFLWTQQSSEVLAACMQTAREQTHHVSAGGYAIMETFKKEVSRKRQRKCPRGAECQQL